MAELLVVLIFIAMLAWFGSEPQVAAAERLIKAIRGACPDKREDNEAKDAIN